MRPRNGSTRRGRKLSQATLRASRICWICGHDGADAADHIIPLVLGGPDTAANRASAHSVEPCPTCRVRCNLVKGGREYAPIVRRSGSLNRPDPGTAA